MITKAPPEPAEDSVALRVAVLVTVMASSVAVLHEGVGSATLWLAVLVGLPAAFAIAYITRRSRPVWLRTIATGLATFAVLAFAFSFSGGSVGSFSGAQIPLAEVFIWLQILHALDSPGRHALMVSLLSSIVLITIAGVFSISMAIVPWLILWGAAALTSLVLAHRREFANLPSLNAPRAVGPRPLTRGRPAGHALGTAVAVGAALLAVIVLGTGLFMLAPVAGADRALTFPAELPQSRSVPIMGGIANPSLGGQDPSLPPNSPRRSSDRSTFGYFGFSQQLDTGTRGRPDDTLVMRVRADAPDYWRGQTFDEWDGRVWRVSKDRVRVLSGSAPIRVPPVAENGPALALVGTDELVQTYYVERSGPNAIFGAATPERVYFVERNIFQLPDGSLRAPVQLDEGTIYTVVSRRRLATPAVLRVSPANAAAVPLTIRRYASEDDVTPRVAALATKVTAGLTNNYDKVLALEDWMGRHTKYTLDIPPLPEGRDAVEQFLFEDKRGFCEQIGTSLVVMLRSLGIPARLVVGYATGERNPFTGLYEVKASDAHAWAEVYFPGVGWQGFDPTANVPLAGDSNIAAAGVGSFAYLAARITLPEWVPVLLAFAFGVGVIVMVTRAVLRRRRARPAPPRSWSATRLARLEKLGARRGRSRSPGETAREYADALAGLGADDRPRSVVEVVDRDMFSGHPASEREREEVDALLDRLADEWHPQPSRT